MKVPAYTPTVAPQPLIHKPQVNAHDAVRADAEARLREIILQKHAELEPSQPHAELGKHLDIRA
jgi:hypothetical protein